MPPTSGIDVCKTIDEALEKARSYGKDIFIIGGSSIYKQTMPLADKMYISYVKKEYDGDVFFPEFDENAWNVENREDYPEFELVVYARKKNNGKY